MRVDILVLEDRRLVLKSKAKVIDRYTCQRISTFGAQNHLEICPRKQEEN